MAVILALDTTGDTFSVAVYQGRCLAELSGQQPRTHLRHLLPGILAVCSTAGLTLDDITNLAVTVGPGSFTGVRLGILTGRTLAQTRNLPISPVKTLDALALNGRPRAVVLAANDARRGELYSALYRLEEKPVTLEQGAARSPDEVRKLLQKWPQAQVVGNAWPRYGQIFTEVTGQPPAPPRDQRVRAEAVARLAAQGDQSVSWLEIEPEYLRPPDVQVS